MVAIWELPYWPAAHHAPTLTWILHIYINAGLHVPDVQHTQIHKYKYKYKYKRSHTEMDPVHILDTLPSARASQPIRNMHTNTKYRYKYRYKYKYAGHWAPMANSPTMIWVHSNHIFKDHLLWRNICAGQAVARIQYKMRSNYYYTSCYASFCSMEFPYESGLWVGCPQKINTASGFMNLPSGDSCL